MVPAGLVAGGVDHRLPEPGLQLGQPVVEGGLGEHAAWGGNGTICIMFSSNKCRRAEIKNSDPDPAPRFRCVGSRPYVLYCRTQ